MFCLTSCIHPAVSGVVDQERCFVPNAVPRPPLSCHHFARYVASPRPGLPFVRAVKHIPSKLTAFVRLSCSTGYYVKLSTTSSILLHAIWPNLSPP